MSASASVSYYPFLRLLFVAGCLLHIILTFVPSIRLVRTGFFGIGGSEVVVSEYHMVQLAIQTGQTGLALLVIAVFGAWIALLVMAFVYERQWVFILGGVLAAFTVLLKIFAPNNPSIQYLLLPRVLGYVATAFMLLGFFARPPKPEEAPA